MSPPPGPLRVRLIHAHPFPRTSRVQAALLRAARQVSGLSIQSIYEAYPDCVIDVKAEQAALAEAEVLVLQHPFYWYSCPSLLKEWIDSVFEFGWAYAGGTALKGKYWMQAISAGGPAEAYRREGYNHFTIEELLRPFEQTAYLCGMIPLKPFLIQGARAQTEGSLLERAGEYALLLERLKEGRFPERHSSL
ncbi:MAG: NAD(P)H-dependent oxidoreductase [Bdellovibrionales bacterium]|nr:NAD(P)H-dependent oxidoreductase [Bdellovibrionales bacterium]